MNPFQYQCCLVTGGFGFIGSHLVRKLYTLGADVHIITRSSTNPFRLKNELSELHVHEADLVDTTAIEEIVSKVKPDYVFHLAGYGTNADYDHPIDATLTNVLGSVNLMHALTRVGCKKMIHLGTCSEYGNSQKELLPENIYGSTKAAATIILHQLAKEHHIDLITLRPFGVFGEYEEPHKIFSHIILKILKGEEVALTTCTQYRDYCHVDNIVHAMLLGCISTNVTNDIFDVGSGDCRPLHEYVDLIFHLMNTRQKPLYGAIDHRSVELWKPEAQIQKIKAKLNFTLVTPLEVGLQKTIEWYKNNTHLFFTK